MATEEDRQEERERLGNDPLSAPQPSAEQLEEENPLEGPAEELTADERRQASSAEKKPSAEETDGP